MTLMTCARKICSMIDEDPNSITEIYFFQRKIIRRDEYIKGVLMKSYFRTIIVPDINNAENILQYDIKKNAEDIINDLVDNHWFSQRDAANILRYSQSTVSRIKNKENGGKRNECTDTGVEDLGGIKEGRRRK